jgi:hypothetical protein
MSFIRIASFLAFSITASAFRPIRSEWSNTHNSSGCHGPTLPLGSGPVPHPDTAEAFISYEELSKAALTAHTPAGFENSFSNLGASIEGPKYYLGYYDLEEYSPSACADHCDGTHNCNTFDVFFERSPTVDPNPHCKNPPSSTLIKCSLWSLSSKNVTATATNNGQWRYDFRVVIGGSNGYVRKYEGCPGYNVEYLGNAAIDAPLDCKGTYTYLGYKVYDSATYDLTRCAEACAKQNEYNVADPPKNGSHAQPCHFVNSYMEKKNGVLTGQYCALYSKAWHKKYATNYGRHHGEDLITISHSVGLFDATGEYDACIA